jgi:hypothetical protein
MHFDEAHHEECIRSKPSNEGKIAKSSVRRGVAESILWKLLEGPS